MAKVSRNFRLEPEVLRDLQGLAERWGVSQARVIELLVREAVEQDKTLRTEIVPRSGAAAGEAGER